MAKNILHRRLFLQGLAASSCVAASGWPMVNAASAQDLSAQRITDSITLVSGAGGNVTLHRGEQGLTLIDSGRQDLAPELLSLVDELSGSAPVKTLFNTHWHEDHTGGNEALHARGARIIAHENTRLWLGADFDVAWRQWQHQPRPPQALPDSTVYDAGKLDLGEETLIYEHVPQAHTDGDLYLHFPVSNVLVAGGLLSNKRYPIADIATGGWIGGLISANATLLARVDDNTIIVPDRGPALKKADLQAQHDMLADLYEQMKTLARQGLSGHEMLLKGVTSAYDPLWGDPEEFVLETYRGMWAHTYDMGGFI
ncbi:MAG: MBL fold metallo-hydrolase [Pseudomonadales bacterium]|nr:MBL fold metallo-hydrolase [Pseudomonadales bacterium]